MKKSITSFLFIAMIFIILFAFPIFVHSQNTYEFVLKWGSYGTSDGQFDIPIGVAIDLDGNVYVADCDNSRIQKFDSNGSFLTKWGSYGTGDGQFFYPVGVAVDLDGNVYVCDGRIHKFDSNGNFLIKWGSYGHGDGEFSMALGVAVDLDGNVYVADNGNNRIQKFDTNGNFLTKWGSYGTGDGQFDGGPWWVAVDSDGNVYASDSENRRIQKFDTNGNFLTKWGSYGTGDGQFIFPYGVAVDSAGNVYVSDASFDRIQKFDSNGTFLIKWGSHGHEDGQFNQPIGIAFDLDGNVYVADSDNDRIQKFSTQLNQPPVALCKNIEITSNENCQATIVPEDVDGGSYDPDGDEITLSIDNLGPFGLGEHWINLTVTDENGESETCQAKVTVVDTTSPLIESFTVNPNVLWPPNHKMVLITPTIIVSDNCDPNPVVELTSITMNEGEEVNTYDPNYDSIVGDGNTANDIQVDENGNIYLRAERSGTGTGRIYTLTYTVTDASGNSSTASATVTVPHDLR